MSAAPERPAQALVHMLAGAWLAQAISAAAKLGVADLLRDGPRTSADLAAATGTQAEALHRMLRALAASGIFVEDAEGRFGLTPLAGPLRSDAPDGLRPYAAMVGEQWVWRSFGEIGHSLRTGAPAFEHVFGAPVFEHYAAHPAAARIYAEGLLSVGRGQDAAVVAAYDFSAASTVVDVGGGQGGLLTAILAANPDARGLLFDLPHTVEMAEPRLEAAGLARRCSLVAGDFFASVPSGGDLYVLRKVIHDWDDDRARTILRACRAAMGKTSRLLLVEAVVPPGNGPSYAKLLDLLMLVHAGGRERIEAEHRGLLAGAGFAVRRIVPTASALCIIEAAPH